MMRKLLFSLSLMATGITFAAPLSPEDALARLGDDAYQGSTRSGIALKPLKVIKTKVGQPALYLFDKNDSQGFMVVSADDAVTPLLGYSDYNNIDPENLPDGLAYWLGEYTRQIEFLRDNNLDKVAVSPDGLPFLPDWQPIEPLVKTTWDQDAPYNNLCPSIGVNHCYTGCVATAMAQVMKYHEYPEKGQGAIRYNCQTLGQMLTLNFATIKFDWANMLDSYSGSYTSEQATAVAQLMKAAGYSVQMSYSTGTSGAVSGYIPGALVKYFGYDPSAVYIARTMKTYTDWATLIYNNLKDVGPVIYDGTSEAGGHSFVCDGYQGEGYFHFNWGWSGAGNGYFLLDTLNPAVSGLGVGDGSINFNYDQDIVLNIMKPKEGSQPAPEIIAVAGSVEGSVADGNLYLEVYGNPFQGYRYFGDSNMTFDVGLEFMPVDKPDATPIYAYCDNQAYFDQFFMPLDPGFVLYFDGSNTYPYPRFTLDQIKLDDNVKYKATAVYLPEKATEWVPVEPGVGCYNYFYITKSGNQYKTENEEMLMFSCDKLQLDSPLYDGLVVELSATVTNRTATELTRGIGLAVLDSTKSTVLYLGNNLTLSLAPTESQATQWISPLTAQTSKRVTTDTPVYIGLYDMDSSLVYYISPEPVTLKPNPGTPGYVATIEVVGAQKKLGVYQVENSSDFEVATTIGVRTGIFAVPVTLHVLKNIGNNQAQSFMSKQYDVQIIETGDQGTFTTKMSFPNATVGETYYLGAQAKFNNIPTWLGDVVPFKVLANSGVEGIEADADEILIFQDREAGLLYVMGGDSGIASVEVYSLSGTKLASVVNNNDKVELDLLPLGKGIVIATAVDRKGNRKSVKLAL